MTSLNATHLAAFTAKIEEIQTSYRAITDASFDKDYAACFDGQANVLNEVEFSILRAASKEAENALYESNYIKLKNLKVAVDECERQIPVTCTTIY